MAQEENLEAMVAACLRVSLQAMNAIARAGSHADYVRQQSPEKLAVLYGAIADRAIRILEAAGDAG